VITDFFIVIVTVTVILMITQYTMSGYVVRYVVPRYKRISAGSPHLILLLHVE